MEELFKVIRMSFNKTTACLKYSQWHVKPDEYDFSSSYEQIINNFYLSVIF